MDLMFISILFGVFLLLLFMGASITAALGSAALAAAYYLDKNPLSFIQLAFESLASFPLLALPAFILAGALMEVAGISKRLVNIAEAFAGPVTGGLSAATVLACAFFGAISGSGPATTAAVGMLMIPAMVDRGYDKGYAAAITASSGGLGVVIPPSIPMIIFGVSAIGIQPPPEALAQFGPFQSVSIAKLFMAGVFPGFLIAFGLLTVNFLISKKRGYKGLVEHWDTAAIYKSLKEGFWSLLAPFIILGGIYSGYFTPTEAAVVANFYALFVGFFLHKEIKTKAILACLETTTWILGRVLLLLFAATLFGRLIVEERVPVFLAEAILSFSDNTYIIWALIILLLLFVGMFMETLAAIMILTPVLLPVTYMMGVDPVHAGIVIVCSLAVGFQTPPMGDNLFVASGITKLSIEEISWKALPFAAITIMMLFVIAYVPEVSLWLPQWLGY